MNGSVRQRSKGTWQLRYDAPSDGTGKRRFVITNRVIHRLIIPGLVDISPIRMIGHARATTQQESVPTPRRDIRETLLSKFLRQAVRQKLESS